MRFNVIGVADSDGRECDIFVEANTELEAAAIARKNGVFPTKITESIESPPTPVVPVFEEVRSSRKPSLMGTWGLIVLAGGLLLAGYFFFAFDTTVGTEPQLISGHISFGGKRVHHIGLQQDRQLGCTAGLIAAAVGAIMIIVNHNNRKDESSL